MFRATAWLPLAILVLLAALTTWLNWLVQAPGAKNDATQSKAPDLVVDNFTARKLNPTGEVQYVLSAVRMLHFPHDDSSELERVKLESFTPGQPKLTITAKAGRSIEGGDEVRLKGDVVLVREADSKHGQLTVKSEEVFGYPEQGLVKSNVPVTAESPEFNAKADRMEYNHNTRALALINMQATFLRPNKK